MKKLKPETIRRLSRARAALYQVFAWLGRALWSIKWVGVEDPPFSWMAIDKHYRVFINEEGIKDLTDKELVGVIWHEIWHPLSLHFARADKCLADKDGRLSATLIRLWNVATDLAINSRARNLGLALPEGALYPEQFGLHDNKEAEWYLAELLKKVEFIEIPNVANGSGADGMPKPWEGPPSTNSSGSGNGEKEDGGDKGFEKIPAGVSEEEARGIASEVARDLRNHAKKRGTFPGSLEEWVNYVLKPPRIPWQRKFRAAFRRSVQRGFSAYSYQIPSRRSPRTWPLVTPAMIRIRYTVKILIDTSGSMNTEELVTALAEAEGIIRAVGSKSEIIMGDTRIVERKTVRSAKEIKRFLGRGGTSMRAILEELDKEGGADVIVTMTDGETDWPEAMRTRHIALIIDNPGVRGPSFGEVIHVDCKRE